MSDEPRGSPSEYRLQLDLDSGAGTWKGRIEFDLEPNGGACVLDADGLTIDRVTRDAEPCDFQVAPAQGTLTFGVPTDRRSRIAIDFRGAVSRSLNGLYRSQHGGGSLFTAQCEPTGARTIFPCWDRPDRKARFLVTVVADADVEVVANGAVESTRDAAGRRSWSFGATPPMAPYLFYLGVGRFDACEGRSRRATIRVLAPPGRGSAGRYACDSASRILDACEEYYGLPYPLPKLDLVAVEELPFGAMENWGAITFQSNRLLVDPASSSFAPRDVFAVMAHEIAHQWFGNLVTMRWWDDIWLNESFAAFMETKLAERLAPELEPRADFILRVAGMAAAIDGDSLRSTHPVRAAVEHPAEIEQIFDEISYGKGASILSMLEGYLGEEKFRAGVSAYLERFRFGNASTDDLWSALSSASGEAVAPVASAWIDRPGVPVVSARLAGDGLELTQRRFRYLGSERAEPWPIPVVADIDGRTERFLFSTRRHTVRVPASATVHLNPGAAGFYRVQYDPVLYDRLLAALPERSGPDRWIVLEDLAAFLASGDVDWATYARFVDALGPSSDRLTVEAIASAVGAWALDFPELEALQATARRFFAAQTERLGPVRRPGEPATDGILRERISFARTRIDPAFARRMADGFSDWGRVDPDLRLATAVGYARSGGVAEYRDLRSALDRASADADRVRLARSLGWAGAPELVQESLDFAISGGANRAFLPWVIVQAAANPAGRSVVWPWFTAQVDQLTDVFRGSGNLPLVLEYTLPSMGTGRREEVEAFFVGHPLPEGTRGVAKGLERLEIRERLRRHLATGSRAGPPTVGVS